MECYKRINVVFGLVNCPLEIYDHVKSYIDEEMGEGYLNVIEKGARISRSIAHHELESVNKENVMKAADVGDMPWGIAQELADYLGEGFCYLYMIERPYHLEALRRFGAYPKLIDVMSTYQDRMREFYIEMRIGKDRPQCLHISRSLKQGDTQTYATFIAICGHCFAKYLGPRYLCKPIIRHYPGCRSQNREFKCDLVQEYLFTYQVGGFFDNFKGKSRNSSKKQISNSKNHSDKQVLGFAKSIKGEGVEPEMSRDLYSVPKPTDTVHMSDHLQNHVEGDLFPYVSVTGQEEETKDTRLSRLRAYRSAYGKEARPEMRINGIVLEEMEGTIQVQHLKEFVNESSISKEQARQNKKFKPLQQSSFSKPYLQISKITGEYVPLLSSTSDYTDLHFTLEDGRLLDGKTIVQSSSIPSNQNGVFELACDYCISTKDLSQLALKYFLSRPIMKEGFQWGSVSLCIRLSESDTPYIAPKIESMAVVRVPFTTLEESKKDLDHADVVFTSSQVRKFREMFRTGDIADIDRPLEVKAKVNSYSKSTIRGAIKGSLGPEHLGEQEGWEQLKGMRKPLIEDGIASVSAESGEGVEEDEGDQAAGRLARKEDYEAHQEELRKRFSSITSESTIDISDDDIERRTNSEASSPVPIKSSMKKTTRFASFEEAIPPDSRNVYNFD